MPLAPRQTALPVPRVLWRISNHADLLGTGGLLASARWHTAGRPVVYLAESPAAAMLEVLVHLELDTAHRPETYQLLKVEASSGIAHDEVDAASLPVDWPSRASVTQGEGDAWLRSNQTALLRVPSVLVPETWNWLLSPRHSDASQIRIVRGQRSPFDPRFF